MPFLRVWCATSLLRIESEDASDYEEGIPDDGYHHKISLPRADGDRRGRNFPDHAFASPRRRRSSEAMGSGHAHRHVLVRAISDRYRCPTTVGRRLESG